MRELWLAVGGLLLVAGLAGCLGDGTPTLEENAADAASGEQPVGDLEVLATTTLNVQDHPFEDRGSFEPLVDVGPEGTIYVTAHREGTPNQRHSPLWVSHDGGGSFQTVAWADPETGVSNLPVGIEGDFGIDDAGNVYFVDTTNAGTTVARSTDGGHTWELRNVHTFLGPGGDRPWVEAGREDVVVVAWDRRIATECCADEAPVVAVSTDGGLTFPVQTELTGCEAFPEAGEGPFSGDYASGDLAVAPDGTIYLSVNCAGHGVEVHRSTDNGASFEAFAARETDTIPEDFTPVAVDEAGNVYVTWPEHGNGSSDVFYAASTDGGETWGDPVRVSVHGGASLMPWIEAREAGRLAVAYYGAPGHPGVPYEVDENASWFPFVTEVRAATTAQPSFFHAQMTDVPVAEGPECGTTGPCPGGVYSSLEDYLGTDLGPDGRVHVTWDDPGPVSWGAARASLG